MIKRSFKNTDLIQLDDFNAVLIFTVDAYEYAAGYHWNRAAIQCLEESLRHDPIIKVWPYNRTYGYTTGRPIYIEVTFPRNTKGERHVSTMQPQGTTR